MTSFPSYAKGGLIFINSSTYFVIAQIPLQLPGNQPNEKTRKVSTQKKTAHNKYNDTKFDCNFLNL